MVADCGATCAKYLLCLFNFVFFVSIFTMLLTYLFIKIFFYIKKDLFYPFKRPKRMQKNCPIQDNCNVFFSAKFSAYLDCDGNECQEIFFKLLSVPKKIILSSLNRPSPIVLFCCQYKIFPIYLLQGPSGSLKDPQRTRKFKKIQAKKLVKSNKSKKIFYVKLHF